MSAQPPAPPPGPPSLPAQRLFRPPTPGQLITSNIGRYTIGTQIGVGQFGATFWCSDEWQNDLVMKVSLPRGTYEQVRARWSFEIRNLLELRHPNITYVYDAFELDDTFYIVLERCAETIAQMIQRPAFNGGIWFRSITRCLLQGVHYLHLNRYVHKDIHPGNVFLAWHRDELVPTEGGFTFKVGDLGISGLESEIDFFNTTLAPWMLPPEFLDPTFGLMGRTIDIYHSGLLLLAVLEKQARRFSRDEILQGAPRQAAEALGPPYGPPLSRALRRHVAQRTQTAYQLWLDILASGPP